MMCKNQTWEVTKQHWTDLYVIADASQLHLQRFDKLIGRVVTVNGSNQCIVDFQDGGWYDIAPQYLTRCYDQGKAAKQYNASKNSANAIPHRQP